MDLGPVELGNGFAVKKGKPDLDAFREAFTFVIEMNNNGPWWIGDMMNQAEDTYGPYGWEPDIDGISIETLGRYKAVSANVPKENRRTDLPWVFHAIVAKLEPKQQKMMLDLAVIGGLTAEQLRKKVKQCQKK